MNYAGRRQLGQPQYMGQNSMLGTCCSGGAFLQALRQGYHPMNV